jgi:predicted CXXCH cytochrome family protein
MKKYLGALLGIACGVFAASGAGAYIGSYTPGNGINGTPHDLGTAHNGMNFVASPADSLNRICIFCHAPHNTYRPFGTVGGAGPEAPDSSFDYLPLWNHTLQEDLGYTMYDNGTGAPTSGAKASQAIQLGLLGVPGSTSLLCLSCHDGSVAVNSYGNSDQPPASVSSGTTMMASGYLIGKDKYLGNHHPISFDYDQVQQNDLEIREADTAMLTPLTFVREHLYGPGNTMMECATCHSVHNTGNSGESLLWRSDQNSELCLTCHAKGTYTAP